MEVEYSTGEKIANWVATIIIAVLVVVLFSLVFWFAAPAASHDPCDACEAKTNGYSLTVEPER